jgi:hypothetical protein
MLVYFPYRHAIETAHFTKSDEEPGCSDVLCRSPPCSPSHPSAPRTADPESLSPSRQAVGVGRGAYRATSSMIRW